MFKKIFVVLVLSTLNTACAGLQLDVNMNQKATPEWLEYPTNVVLDNNKDRLEVHVVSESSSMNMARTMCRLEATRVFMDTCSEEQVTVKTTGSRKNTTVSRSCVLRGVRAESFRMVGREQHCLFSMPK